MKLALKINWILTILLSISTGIFKLLQEKADIELFAKIGLDATGTTILGAIQLIGGLMLLPPRTRSIGAWVMTATFVVASIAVFANKLIVFGIVSLLFIVMAQLVIYMERKRKNYE